MPSAAVCSGRPSSSVARWRRDGRSVVVLHSAWTHPLARSFSHARKYRDRVIAHVHSHETALVLVSRFLPGLRTAIPVACAYAGVRPLKFSVLNLISAFAWAAAIMAFVKGGSSTLTAFD